MVNDKKINQPLISISDNLKKEKDLIVHVKFWQSKIDLVSHFNEQEEEDKLPTDAYTNYQQLAQSIQLSSFYSESWRNILNKVIEYQTTKRALEYQQINILRLSRESESPSLDILKNQIEISRNQLNNLNQLQSRIEELEKILSQTIKAIYLLGKQENYSDQQIWYLCRSFCQITLKEYRIIRKEMETKPDEISSWQFLHLRNQIWQTISEEGQLSDNYLNQVFSKSAELNEFSYFLTNLQDLKVYLQKEFSYCPCVEGTVLFLRNILQWMNNSHNPQLEVLQKSNQAQLQQQWESHPLLFTWFIFILEQKGLIWHGFNITDCWLTDKGVKFLSVLDKLVHEAESAGLSIEDYL